MSIFIYKNDQQHGPYSIDQVKSWLSLGQLQPTDLAWSEGANTWEPLSTVLNTATYQSAVQNYGYAMKPPSSGWPLIITGAVLTFIGLPLVVFIIGIPMVIVGIPLLIYGRAQYNQRIFWNLKESVRAGVVQGMPVQSYLPPPQPRPPAQQPTTSRPSRLMTTFCSNCAARLDADAKFCPSCGASSS